MKCMLVYLLVKIICLIGSWAKSTASLVRIDITERMSLRGCLKSLIYYPPGD
jgi:hypothetical protein